MSKMNFGVLLSGRQISTGGWSAFNDLAVEFEKLNYHSLWLGDHLTIGGYRLECWTTLSALSAATKKIRLGTMTLCNSYRNPALLAKMAASLDVISGGRLEFGIGSGYYKNEYDAYGYPFPPLSVRTEQLDEGLEIMKKMWTENRPSYKGKYYTIKEAACDPKPVQKPHPPITIGGGNEEYTLKIVAKHANRWNTGAGTMEEYKHKLNVLKRHCDQIGRNYDEIEKSYHFHCVGAYLNNDDLIKAMRRAYEREGKTIYARGREGGMPASFEDWFNDTQRHSLVGTPEECISKLQDYFEIGANYFVLRFIDFEKKESIRFFNEKVINKL